MQRVNEYRFYELGQRIQVLKGTKASSKIHDVMVELWFARVELSKLLSDPLNLTVCVPAARRVVAAITAIIPKRWEEVVQAKEDAQVASAIYELHSSLEAFEPVLAAECAAMDTYVVSQKGGYSTSHLVEQADVLLSVETRDALAENVINDIRAAGRCLAFDTPTAAGFHMLRAVEAVMSKYFKASTDREIEVKQRNWGAYLRDLAAAGGSPKVIGALTHIKDNYRNPITHPDVTLTDSEATLLFALSTSVIDIMVSEMKRNEARLPGLTAAPMPATGVP